MKSSRLGTFAIVALFLGAPLLFSAEQVRARHEKVRLERVSSIRKVLPYDSMNSAVSTALARLQEISISNQVGSDLVQQLLQGDRAFMEALVVPRLNFRRGGMITSSEGDVVVGEWEPNGRATFANVRIWDTADSNLVLFELTPEWKTGREKELLKNQRLTRCT